MNLASASYFAAALGLITGPLVARALGPAGRGEYAAVLIYSDLAIAIVGLGLTRSINYSLQTLNLDPRRVLGVVWRFSALVILPSLLIGVVVSTGVLSGFSTTAQIAALVFVGLAPMGVLQRCLTSFLLAEGALGVLTRVQVAPLLINAAAVVALAVVGQLTLTNYLIATFVTMVVPVAMSIRGVRIRPARGGRLGPQLRFGLRAYPGTLASFANGRLDQALIAPFLGAADLGYYAIAVSMANLPLGLVQAVAARGVSEVGRPGGGLDPDLAGPVIRRGVVVTVLVAIGVAVVVPFFIPLVYGSAFASSVPLALILLVGTLALGVAAMSSFCLNLAGKPGATSIAELLSLVVTAVGLLVMLPTLGVIGAATVSALAYWTRALVQIRALHMVGVTRIVPTWEDVTSTITSIWERAPLPWRR
jgi:O-antigen/teichoic acid export membrane protein